jgi:hypothetical protein
MVSFAVLRRVYRLLAITIRTLLGADISADHVAHLHRTFGTYYDNGPPSQAAGCCKKNVRTADVRCPHNGHG